MTVKEQEEKILQFWKKKKIYEKIKVSRKNAKKFYFLDGPPYATGYIHIGTAMNKIMKDFFIRFFRMSGFNVWDQPGYDTHGLPIENKVEKNLSFKSKADIEKFGIENFNMECRKFATQFIGVMNDQFNNLGVWMDWNRPYLTLTNEYIEGAWFTFKKGFEKGLLYRDNYSVHFCPRCETAVAYNEIEYTQLTDPSIYVKFPVKDKKNEFLVIWTTTPWTIPSNTGIMAKPDADYVKVKVKEEILIMAKRLLETVMNKANITNYEVLETVKGKDLEGMRYEHPLKDIFPFLQNLKDAHRVVLSDQFVTLEDGTGLVHTAPGHGQEDYKVGKETGLPILSPLKLNGRFDETAGGYTGIFAKDADPMVIQELKNRGVLLHEEKVTHDYPLCWRCESPLLMMAIPQWFFKVTAIRQKLIEENKKINWTPDWAGQRFHNWLESLGDWPISRQRYWGIPLPIWICEKCSEITVIGSIKELPKKLKDLHRPYIDDVTLKCKKCKGVMRRVPDVLDVWFDSGVSSWAPLGYPTSEKLFKKIWPVDFVLEGPDQIRGWWNSSMITSVLTFDRRPFENILFHGFVLDAHGNKMAKSKGNIINPEDVIEKYGRDILRFYFLNGAPWDDYFFKWEDVEEIMKSFVVVRNTFNFVKTYVTGVGKPKGLKEEDNWILSKLNTLIENCTQYNKTFNVHKSSKEILDFILNDFSRWYIKIIRDRVWPTFDGKDKLSAFYTLFTVTRTLAMLLAPVCPFLSEEIFQNIIKPLKKDTESVHLLYWPKSEKKFINTKLEREMELVKRVVEACQAARQKANLKLKWPVKSVLIVSKEKDVIGATKNLNKVLLNMCNCKKIKVVKNVPSEEFSEAEFSSGRVLVEKELDDELLKEAMLRELIRKIQDLRKKNGFNVKQSIILTLNSDENTKKVLRRFVNNLKKEVGAKKVGIGKLKGKFIDVLTFRERKIEIRFS
jgi:isoleucyl-tRNA synthetase